jgi:hypothetical protein
MNGLRWSLLAVTLLISAGWLGLWIFASGFRRSWGASQNAAWKVIGPSVVMLVFLLSLIMPEQTVLRRVSGAIALCVAIGCLAIVKKAPGLAMAGLAYVAAWLAFIGQ